MAIKAGDTVKYIGPFVAGSRLLPRCIYFVTAVDSFGLLEVRDTDEDGRAVPGATMASKFEVVSPEDIRF